MATHSTLTLTLTLTPFHSTSFCTLFFNSLSFHSTHVALWSRWLPWRVLASTGQVLRSTHFFAGTMGTVDSTHRYYRVL